MRKRSKQHQLENVPLFAACDDDELDLLWTVARRVHFDAGQVLAVEGEPGDRFVVILEGSAQVTVGDVNVSDLGPGDFFGEVALLDGGPRTATVRAGTAVEAYAIARDDFRWILQSAPSLTENLLIGVARRLRDADRRLLG
jgi:CRP/FNR family cyclic AMP-dependent transcriptional regulator